MNTDLYNFIQSELKAGKSTDQIVNALNATGHTPEEIDEIIQYMSDPANQQDTPMQQETPIHQTVETQQNAEVQQNVSEQNPPPQQPISPQPELSLPPAATTSSPAETSKPPKKKSFFSMLKSIYDLLNPKEEPPNE